MIKKIILSLLLLYLILAIGFYLFQEKVIFRGKKLKQDFAYQFDYPFKEVNFTAKDKSIINALHFTVEDPKGVILYFHGNKGSLERWGNIVAPYTNYGYDVFVIDFRGYGKHLGKRSEEAMYSDALQSYSYLKGNYSEDQIVVYGRSLGCTFATKVAAENSPKHLILEAPFYNLKNLSKSKFQFLPYDWLLRYRFESNKLMPLVGSPVTIFHGDNDAMIPLSAGQRLFEKVKHKNSEFVLLPTGTHHNLGSFEAYKTKLLEIL